MPLGIEEGNYKILLDEEKEVIDEYYDQKRHDFFAKQTSMLKQEQASLSETDKKNAKELAAIKSQLERIKQQETLVIEIENLKKVAAEGKSLKDRQAAEDKLKEKEKELEKLENAKKTSDVIKAGADQAVSNIMDGVKSGISAIHSGMTEAAKTYASYFDRIQVRLVGTSKTYQSVADTMNDVFGASPIFKMTDVMEKVSAAIESGVNFNVETRAAMQVISEKVAASFEAFNTSLLRIIRIQQEDSTQARLGMESLLTEFLNSNYQDSTYLQSLSKTVTNSLIEATSLYDAKASTEFEYAVQKWLGSVYSLGLSDNLVNQLAEGIGYLASGNINALSSNDTLQTLLVATANRGGADYGSMLLNGMTVEDVDDIMTGLLSLAQEISGMDSNVALSAYANVFGMTVSDIQSLVNLTDEQVKDIVDTTASYDDFITRVTSETTLSKLLSRTSAAELADNLYQNFLWNAGMSIGDSVFGYLSWQLTDVVADALKGINVGVDIKPFGVGTGFEISISDIVRAVSVLGGSIAGISNMMGSINSISGVDLTALPNDTLNTVQKGTLVSMAQEGTSTSQTTYSGDFSEGALAETANATIQEQTAKYQDETYDEEKEKTEKMVNSMSEVSTDLKFIVQLLNESGIVIRGRVGTVLPVSQSASSIFDDTLASEDISIIMGTV